MIKTFLQSILDNAKELFYNSRIITTFVAGLAGFTLNVILTLLNGRRNSIVFPCF